MTDEDGDITEQQFYDKEKCFLHNTFSQFIMMIVITELKPSSLKHRKFLS